MTTGTFWAVRSTSELTGSDLYLTSVEKDEFFGSEPADAVPLDETAAKAYARKKDKYTAVKFEVFTKEITNTNDT
jgi:hypothetical protein